MNSSRKLKIFTLLLLGVLGLSPLIRSADDLQPKLTAVDNDQSRSKVRQRVSAEGEEGKALLPNWFAHELSSETTDSLFPHIAKSSGDLAWNFAPESNEESHADQPDEAIQWRTLQLVDENGYIPENALINAWEQGRQIPYDPTAWPGKDETKGVGDHDIDVGGIQPSGWTWVGPGNIGGRIRAIVIHPTNPQIMWIGSVSGGIWKTTNAGASWVPQNDFMANLSVGSMAIDPTNANVIYAGTGEGYFNGDSIRGAGVFKTTDGGTTWTQLSSTNNSNWHYVNRLAISPTNSQIILAATNSGIWRTTDGGSSWSNRLSSSATDIDFDPTDGNKAIASGNFGTGVRFSTDAGASWSASTGVPTNGRIEVAYSRSNTSFVYASADNNDGEVYFSSDGGHSFVLRNGGSNFFNGGSGSQGWYDNTLWVDPTNSNIVIVGGIFLWRSTNGGSSFTQVGSLHADQHAIVQSPQFNGTTNKVVFFGNDGGIYQTSDVYASSPALTVLNNNLGITQFYGGAGNSSSGRIIGGTQDNSTLRYSGSQTWGTTFCCYDGGFCAADQTDSNYFYGETQWLGLFRSTDAGQSGNFINSGIADSRPQGTNFISPLTLDPNNPSTLLAGGLSLWRSTNVKASTPTWSTIKNAIGTNYGTDSISAVAMAKGNSNIVWVGHNNGDVYFTSNGTSASPNWTRVDNNSLGLPNRYCTRITIDPLNSSRVYVTFGGFSSDNVWRTDNSGNSWTNITNGLPSAPVRTLAVWQQNTNNLYVGTEVGIFASANGGQSWSPSNDGPTNCSVDELFWMNNTLVAATHGRGMFSIPITESCSYTLNPTSRSFDSSGGSNSFTVTTGANCPWTATVNAPNSPSLVESQQEPDRAVSSSAAPQDLFVNLTPITVNDRSADTNPPGTASLYPSTINVSGMTGTITNVDVGLNGVSHTFPDDMDVLLVGPGGQSVMLMSDAGGNLDINSVDLIFEQGASSTLPDSTQITGGTYRPTNFAGSTTLEPNGVDNFPSSGPGTNTYSANLDVFNGTSPNGTWKLYVVDDEHLDGGSFANGWALGILTSGGGGSNWITITSGSSGTGNGTVNYTVAANSNSNSRTGTITVNGQVHTVTQSGTGGGGCTYTISSTENLTGPGMGSTNYFMTAPSGCAWTAVSDATSWLTTSSSGSGNGTIRYDYSANNTTTTRVGHITAGGKVHTVTDIGIGGGGSVQFSSATYSINEAGGSATINVTRTGGTASGTVNYSTSNGTATAGQDYTATSSVLIIPENVTTTSFTVPILDDTAVEGNETINLTLSQSSSAFTLGNPSTAVLTIVDNDTSTGGWTDTDNGVGGDNKLRTLWNNSDGRVTLWIVQPDGTYQATTYGPYAGWSAKAIATGPDNLMRVLWVKTDGTVSLWVVAADGTFQPNVYGPYAGWTAQDIAVGNDNQRRVLWTNTDGSIALWSVSASGSVQVTVYGPYAGWTARRIAAGSDNKTRVLWTNTDGRISLWTVNGDGTFQPNLFGPYSGWSGTDIGVGGDNRPRVLWSNVNGSCSLWVVNADGSFQANVYGPYSGWTVRTIASGPDNRTRVLWTRTDGMASQWVVNLEGTFSANLYGPY